jgi:hypothetical protein
VIEHVEFGRKSCESMRILLYWPGRADREWFPRCSQGGNALCALSHSKGALEKYFIENREDSCILYLLYCVTRRRKGARSELPAMLNEQALIPGEPAPTTWLSVASIPAGYGDWLGR